MTSPAPLAFVDTETTGLDPERHEVWEVGLVLRDADGKETERHWFLPIDLGKADPQALTVGRFYERYCEPHVNVDAAAIYLEPDAPVLEAFAAEFAVLTHGAHLVGAVPSFDANFLARLLRANGACPGWHYHLVDVEALAIGYLAARGTPIVPPWKSDQLTAALGIDVDEDSKHTALGDVRWAMAIYDSVTGAAT